MWYRAYLLKQAMGAPLSATFDAPFVSGTVPGRGHELSDYRLAEKWLDSLSPMYREVPLSRARARLQTQGSV